MTDEKLKRAKALLDEARRLFGENQEETFVYPDYEQSWLLEGDSKEGNKES